MIQSVSFYSEQRQVRAKMKQFVDPRIFIRSIDCIKEAAFSCTLVGKDCCFWKCTEIKFSQRVDAQVSTWKSWSHHWVCFETTRLLSGIQFTTHFIEFIVMVTKQFVGSNVNVILTRQTCGQRSSRAAESKRRAPGNYLDEWTCYMFLIPKSEGDWDQGLCTFWVLAKREPLRIGDFRKKNAFRPQEKSGFGIVHRFSFCKYPRSAQTWISVSSTFWY